MATAQRTNKEVVQHAFDALNERDRETFEEVHAADAVVHAFGKDHHGTDAIVAEEFGYFEAFPDLTYTLDVVLAEDDMVAARWTASGSHEGEFNGIEPTGEKVEFPVMGTFRIEDERATGVWIVADRLGLLQQLGVNEPPME